MKTRLALFLAIGFLILTSLAAKGTAGQAPVTASVPAGLKIQLAILLDTSNSMDGLIDQAKSQLWNIVNELSRMKREGKTPRLEVALFEYGNDSIPAGEGHIRMVSGLTDDLDKISESLFALRTNGGSEYCGQVVGSAVDGLAWNQGRDDLRMIVISGNEPFDQGKVLFAKTCQAAARKGIVVNTIYCGGRADGIRERWAEGAAAGGGKYSFIDQNVKAPVITAPQDDEIARLGTELNKTYVAFGRAGESGKMRQEAQDVNAASVAPSVNAQRAIAKASASYRNSGWDLVDAKKEKSVDVSNMKEEDLPEEMRKMTPEEREKYLAGKAGQREEIQRRILSLQTERDKYINEKRREKATETPTLDEAILQATRDAASERGFK